MTTRLPRKLAWAATVVSASLACGSCRGRAKGNAAAGRDPNVTTLGSIEITARLVDVPSGAIFRRKLYDYATVLEYRVLQTHRGRVHADTVFVAHYNPYKPRSRAADRFVKGVGGNLPYFRPEQVHRMALAAPLEDHYMGAIVNKHFGRDTGPIYWAVWTNLADP